MPVTLLKCCDSSGWTLTNDDLGGSLMEVYDAMTNHPLSVCIITRDVLKMMKAPMMTYYLLDKKLFGKLKTGDSVYAELEDPEFESLRVIGSVEDFIKKSKHMYSNIFLIGFDDSRHHDSISLAVTSDVSGSGPKFDQFDEVTRFQAPASKRIGENYFGFFYWTLTKPEFKQKSTAMVFRNQTEINYLELLKSIAFGGKVKDARNARIKYLLGPTLQFDLQLGFPLLTTKRVFFKGVREELLMFLRGETDTKVLEKQKINIWQGNTSEEYLRKNNLPLPVGEMGPMYGYQWRNFGGTGHDQLAVCLEQIKKNPGARDILMTSYNPIDAPKGVLRPCHGIGIMFDVEEIYVQRTKIQYKLNCTMMQRSADMFLGVPFNIASYALLMHMMCSCINVDPAYKHHIIPGLLTMCFHNAHLYPDHIGPALMQAFRVPMKFPELRIRNPEGITDPKFFTEKNVELIGYRSHYNIPGTMYA